MGINSLEALASTVDSPELPICTALDARKRELYAAVFENNPDGPVPVIPESALAPEALCAAIEAPTLFIGNGVDRYRDLFRKSLRDRFV